MPGGTRPDRKFRVAGTRWLDPTKTLASSREIGGRSVVVAGG